jgi:protein-tyrosine phosphatase
VFKFFKKKKKVSSVSPLTIDLHSHLLPGLDDGVTSVEESIEILKEMQALGYRKVITTPHVMKGFYPNTAEQVREKLQVMRQAIREHGLTIRMEAAAEYYLDEDFMKLLKTPHELLVISGEYLLFETPFMNKPAFLKEAIFQISNLGWKPILAHPERYIYLQQDPQLLDELLEMKVLLQINLNSLAGKYSKEAKQLAESLIERKLVSFVGSDCHHIQHLKTLRAAIQKPSFKKLMEQGVLNNKL